MTTIRVMISSIPLPSQGIGSWTKMIDYFNENSSFLDFILSPGPSDGRFIRCKKRRWLSYYKPFRKFLLANWVARDFLKEIIKLHEGVDQMKVVVQDDLALLEAIADFKRKNPSKFNIELIFYFQGFHLNFSKDLDEMVDKVLFLSQCSYQFSLNNNLQFTPESFIVGNFVNQNIFLNSDPGDKLLLRKKFGIPPSAKVITWMANDRRVKGLHLFEKLIPFLLELYPDLYFLIIGSNLEIFPSNENVKNVGRIQQNFLSEYLRSSDFYLFPSLWMEGFGLSVIEAKLSGNWILSSSNGSLKEVLSPYKYVFFVDKPNIMSEWLKAFKLMYTEFEVVSGRTIDDQIDAYSYDSWVIRFESAVG